MQRVTRWVDPTYLRNRLVCISLSQSSFIGEEFQTDPSGLPPVFPRDQCERWDVDALRGAAAQHPHQRRLWIFPGALSPDACADITEALRSALERKDLFVYCGHGGGRSCTFDFFDWELRRRLHHPLCPRHAPPARLQRAVAEVGGLRRQTIVADVDC